MTCHCSDGTDKLGDHRRKLYHDIFASIVPKAIDQIVDIICKFTPLK